MIDAKREYENRPNNFVIGVTIHRHPGVFD